MKPIIETKRLILREILLSDELDLFEMDRDPEVHRFLGNDPLTDLTQIKPMIEHIHRQYIAHGIGRWAVIEKKSQEFIGWSGLKFYNTPINHHINFYELGYRFNQKYWGQGFATESAQAWLNYGFEQLQLQEVFAMTNINHAASKNVLSKIGFQHIEVFDYDGEATDWFKAVKKTQI